MFKLEVLPEKPWYFQAAVFGLMAAAVYFGFWYMVTSGTRAETAEIEEKVVKLKQGNMHAQIASQRLNEFKANYAQAKADYEDLKALLPEQRELTMVLQNVQDRARGRLTVRRFTPKDEVQQDFYTGKPIELEVSGTYNNVGQFFQQLASYQRIVSVTDFKITRLKESREQDKIDGKTVDAQFLLTAYYASPEKLQAPAAQPAAAPAANGAPAPAPAAK
jgi:type IV pilus assembly protein PilO